MGKLTIDGQEFDVPPGASVSVRDGNVIIGGVNATNYPQPANVHVTITGDVGSLRVDGSATVHGNVGKSVEADGNVTVEGSVTGRVTAGGSITCGDVGDSASAVGSITCGTVGGSVTAGGSVRHS